MSEQRLGCVQWWPVVVDDAAQLSDVLNEAGKQGFDIHAILPNTPAGFVVVLKALLTAVNVQFLGKGFSHAAKEKAACQVSPQGVPVHVAAATGNAVGEVPDGRRGDRRAKNGAAAKHA
jgi:hypothetical protein